MYQTDWSISALQILKDDGGPFNLAMAPLKINEDKKLYGTSLPIRSNVKGMCQMPNSRLPIEIDRMKIVILDAIGSSGLDLKTDPGVPVLYTGFGALMLTTCISYLSHSQIRTLQDGTAVIVGGKTNREKAEFPSEINPFLNRVPELVESSKAKQIDSISG